MLHTKMLEVLNSNPRLGVDLCTFFFNAKYSLRKSVTTSRGSMYAYFCGVKKSMLTSLNYEMNDVPWIPLKLCCITVVAWTGVCQQASDSKVLENPPG